MLRLLGAWLRPVERTVRVREVARSNRAAPTKQYQHRPLRAEGGVFFKSPRSPAEGPLRENRAAPTRQLW